MSNFKVSNNGGDDWLICWTGQDEKGVHWNVTTNKVHASELFQFSKGAEEDARLIAKLLDMHYTGQLIHTESIQNKLANYDAQAEQLKQVEANYDALQTPMPCGHLARYAVNGEEGTQYCCMCHVSNLDGTIDVLHKTLREIATGLDEAEGCTCEMGEAPGGEQYHAISCSETLAIIARRAIGE